MLKLTLLPLTVTFKSSKASSKKMTKAPLTKLRLRLLLLLKKSSLTS